MSDLRIGVIGGSGIGGLFAGEAGAAGAVLNVVDTPFGPTSAAITEVRWHGVSVLLLPRHGVGHVLGPSAVPYRANIFALKKLGVTHILATGAVGSLRQEFAPRDLVVPNQVIDKTRRAATFFEHTAVHVEFAEPFCPVLRKLLLDAATEADPSAGEAAPPRTAHDGGCYVAMEGPAFSTRAESHMHRLWGGDLIGMTAMPEAKLAKEAEIPYALVALVTDYDAWKQPPAAAPAEGTPPAEAKSPDSLLEEIIANLAAASTAGVALVRRAIALAAADPARVADCPARTALARAIWSDKAHIPAAEVDRLAPLWIQYFDRPTV